MTIAQVIWASIHGWMALELRGIGFVADQVAGFNEPLRRDHPRSPPTDLIATPGTQLHPRRVDGYG